MSLDQLVLLISVYVDALVYILLVLSSYCIKLSNIIYLMMKLPTVIVVEYTTCAYTAYGTSSSM